MKNQFLLGISLCFFTAAQAQSSHTVDFNSYVSASSNDLTNNFTGSFALTQQTTNGITGGSALPAATLVYNTKHCIMAYVISVRQTPIQPRYPLASNTALLVRPAAMEAPRSVL